MTRCLCLLMILACTAVPVNGQGTADKQADAGWQALQRGDASTAATAFADALSRHPRDPVLHLGFGAAAHLLGRESDAIASLSRSLELNPKLSAAAELLGRIEYQQGDLSAAIRLYEQAIASLTTPSAAMQKRLNEWQKEAAVHEKLTERNDGRFSIVFDGRSENMLAEHTVAVLNRAFSRIGEKIGAFPPDRILVTLYTEQQFRDVTRLPAWSTGGFDGKIRIPVQGASENLDRFDRVLAHELTHAMIHKLAPQGVPAWLHEGLAGYFEPRDPVAAQRRIQARNAVMPFSELQEPFSRFNADQAAFAYEESLFAADVLMHLVGPRMAMLLEGMGRGQSFDESLPQLGLRSSDFESQVLRRLRP